MKTTTQFSRRGVSHTLQSHTHQSHTPQLNMPQLNMPHHRHSIRLKGYDYSADGFYFITICTKNRQHLFGHVVNGEMVLNEKGQIVKSEWLNTINVRQGEVILHEFVVMPNHFHAIIEICRRRGVSHTPQSHLPQSHTSQSHMPQSHTPNNDNVSHTPQSHTSQLHTPNNDNVSHTRNNDNKSHTRNNDVCDTNRGVCDTNRGVCDTTGGVCDTTGGVCDTPLRSPSKTLGAIVRGFKSAVSKKIGFSVWQRNYHEHIIRDSRGFEFISKYIRNNPACWDKDMFNK